VLWLSLSVACASTQVVGDASADGDSSNRLDARDGTPMDGALDLPGDSSDENSTADLPGGETNDDAAVDAGAADAPTDAADGMESPRVIVRDGDHRRLFLHLGATIVVNRAGRAFGWGDYLGTMLGTSARTPVRRPVPLKFDFSAYQYSFGALSGGWMRRVRSGDGEVDISTPTSRSPFGVVDRFVIGASNISRSGYCAVRSDGTWCLWSSWPSPRRISTTRFCAFVTGYHNMQDIACNYDCVAGSIACRDRDTPEGPYMPYASFGGAVALELGDRTDLAVRSDGSLWCRGACFGLERDNPGTPPEFFRRALGIDAVVSVAYSPPPTNTGCALRSDGTVWCWGTRSRLIGRSIGPDDTGEFLRPAPILGLRDVVDVEVSAYHGCAITRAEEVWCWGGNDLHGVQPESSEEDMITPVRVLLPEASP